MSVDPVRARRARIARLVAVGQRVGYGLFALAIVLFVVGFVTSASTADHRRDRRVPRRRLARARPAIVFGYAVKAAEREDRERGL